MLKDINKRRPDRKLERSLVFLAYTVMFMSLTMFSLFFYPQYSIYLIIGTVVFNLLCSLITLRILKLSEDAIAFGTLASEIINDKTKLMRVDNSENKAVLCNRLALDYFSDKSVMDFLENNIIDTAANKLDLQKLKSAINKLQPATVELSVNPAKDSVFVAEEWLRISIKPIYLDKTDIFEGKYSLKKIRKESYIFWVIENITAYKNMEQVFKEERTSLHNFIDYMPIGVYSCDNFGRIEYINNTLADYIGVEKNSVNGMLFDDFIAHNSEQMHTQNGNFTGNVMIKKSSGNSEVFIKQKRVKENDTLKSRGAVIWDVPNDKELKLIFNLMRDKTEWLFNNSPIGIIFADGYLKIMEVNQNIEKIFAQSQEKLVGQNVGDYFDAVSNEKMHKALTDFIQGKENSIKFETNLKPETEEKNVEVCLYPMHTHYIPEGNVANGIIIYVTDITNRRNLEMQVAQAQKMQAFGQLAGSVAHDFNNLMTAVIGFCDLLIQRHGVGDASFSDLLQIKQNANRAAEVARQLLAISRKQPFNPKMLNVTESFAEIEPLLSRALNEKITMKITHAPDLGMIRVDSTQFSQVLLNLVVNAKDAINGKGEINISTRRERLHEAYQFGPDLIQPGDFVVISVTDTGCGIPDENKEKIFEPFFSTKKNIPGSGTGLGLAMVYGIVRQTEGFIKLFSEVGKGTTFEIYLPEFENKTEDAEETTKIKESVILDKTGKAALTTMGNTVSNISRDKMILGLNISAFDSMRNISTKNAGTRIIFVDDEDAVRKVGVRGLKRKGFDVVECISAENALEYIKSGEPFQMLITDMMMPGLSGADLAKIVHKEHPEVKIILASGYSEEIARNELAGSADFYFIGKPYSLEALNIKITEVLGSHE